MRDTKLLCAIVLAGATLTTACGAARPADGMSLRTTGVTAPATVSGTQGTEALSAFERHRRRGSGRYLDREDIARLNAHRLSDVLRSLPGVSVVGGDLRMGTNGAGRACAAAIWIDGAFAPGSRVDDVSITDVEAVEVYRGSSVVPQELVSPSARSGCGTLAVWTRRQ